MQRITAAEFRQAQIAARKRPKYGNRCTTTPDGEKFDSISEAERWEELKCMQAAGEISELKRQVRIPLLGMEYRPLMYDTERQAVYVADFTYLRRGEQVVTIEDRKGGPETPLSMLKRAIVQAMCGGRPVIITRKAKRARHPRKRAA